MKTNMLLAGLYRKFRVKTNFCWHFKFSFKKNNNNKVPLFFFHSYRISNFPQLGQFSATRTTFHSYDKFLQPNKFLSLQGHLVI